MEENAKVEVTREQLERQLKEHLRLLEKSALEYDRGDHFEAGRMATEICKLIGDRYQKNGDIKESSKSLTYRLGVKPDEMVDLSLPGIFERTNLHGPVTTMAFTLNGCDGFAPILDGFVEYPEFWTPRKVPFAVWWSAPVSRDQQGRLSSRGDVLLSMRDKEAVHTDASLERAQHQLKDKRSFGIDTVNTNPTVLDSDLTRVITRQAAHELLRTLVPDSPLRYSFAPPFVPQPITLIEYVKRRSDGTFEILPGDPRIFVEQTSDRKVWDQWRGTSAASPQSIHSTKSSDEEVGVRMAALNFSPYPATLQGMVGTKPPAK